MVNLNNMLSQSYDICTLQKTSDFDLTSHFILPTVVLRS